MGEIMIPDRVTEHLKSREGVKYVSYLDTNGHLSGGVGHLMSAEQQVSWPKGSEIPVHIVEYWLEQDTAQAWIAARLQAKHLGCPQLQEALFHVCFQLGTAWNTIHKNTWALLESGDWLAAAAEAEDSRWYKQTPLRVRDFQYGILAATFELGATT